MKKKTVVINLFSNSNVDRSVCAAWLYSHLSLEGYTCAWFGNCSFNKNGVSPTAPNIFCSVGERLATINSFYGDVDFVIMDVPLVEDLIWNKYTEGLSTAIMETFTSFENLNVVLSSKLSVDGTVSEFLRSWNIDYFKFGTTVDVYHNISDVSILRHKELLRRKDGVLSIQNVIELLTRCALRNGFKFLNPSSHKEARFLEYLEVNNNMKYVIRISDTACEGYNWVNSFLEDSHYKYCFISYVITDDVDPLTESFHQCEDGDARYKEAYFSTSTSSNYDLINLEDSIISLVNSDINVKLRSIREGDTVEVDGYGYCIVEKTGMIYDSYYFAPVRIIRVKDSKGDEFRIPNPQRDIISVHYKRRDNVDKQ